MSSVAQRLGEDTTVTMTSAPAPAPATSPITIGQDLAKVMLRLDAIDAAISKCALLADYCNNIVHIDRLQKDVATINRECLKRKAENEALMSRVINLENRLDEQMRDTHVRLFTDEARIDLLEKASKSARTQPTGPSQQQQSQIVPFWPAPPIAPVSQQPEATITFTPLVFGAAPNPPPAPSSSQQQ